MPFLLLQKSLAFSASFRLYQYALPLKFFAPDFVTKLMELLNTCGLPRSLPTTPSTVMVFHVARLPLMFGVVEPKLPPGESVGVWYATPGSTRSSETTSRPRSATCSIWVDVMRADRSE